MMETSAGGGLVLCVALLGGLAGACKGTDVPALDAAPAASASASGATATTLASASASTSAATAPTVPAQPPRTMHAIAEVGEVPEWAPSRRRPSCAPPTDATARLEALAKGDDKTLDDGSADVAKLQSDVTAGCFATERALAQVLATVGSSRLQQKKYLAANRWLRAALYVMPTLDAARYDLARGLVLAGDRADGLWAFGELGRAARAGDPAASSLLERAQTDHDLDPVRDDAQFKEAVSSANGTLIGPRKDPEIAAAAVKTLPNEYFMGPKPSTGGMRSYKPAVVDVYTWKPDPTTELVLVTFVGDPKLLGKPRTEITSDYGGLAVLRREGPKLLLLHARKTGFDPPAIAPSKNGSLVYSFAADCGDLKGALKFKDARVDVLEMSCNDLPP
ncbi:MAG: hypothetical protein NVS3B10_22690 [Polyangiales bacterium]